MYAALAGITAANSTFLAFSIFQAQKARRFEKREEKLEKVRSSHSSKAKGVSTTIYGLKVSEENAAGDFIFFGLCDTEQHTISLSGFKGCEKRNLRISDYSLRNQ